MSITSSLGLSITPLCLVLILLTSACSTIPSSGVVLNSRGIPELSEEFRLGSARLECALTCAGAYGAMRRKLRALHDSGLWADLAIEVLRIGFSNDQAHYYLGTAAEGLGYNAAAEVYYRRTIAVAKSSPKCAAFLVNVCDGFVFPEEAESRLAGVLKKREDEERKTVLIPPQPRSPESPVPPAIQTEDQKRLNCKRAYAEYFGAAQATRDSEKVIALYRAGLKLCPEDDIAHYELGKAFANRKRYVEAEQEFAAALKINPDFADAKKQLEAVRKNQR
jgi:tetratricopeptide (TPR) repeat protein